MVPSKASATIHLRRWRACWSGYVLAGQQDAGARIINQHAVGTTSAASMSERCIVVLIAC